LLLLVAVLLLVHLPAAAARRRLPGLRPCLLLGPQAFLLPLRRSRRQLFVLQLLPRLGLELRLGLLLHRGLCLDRHHRENSGGEHSESYRCRQRFASFHE